MKPHKGTILGSKHEVLADEKTYGPNLGYVIIGTFIDHPNFKGQRGHTSLIVKCGRKKKDGTHNVETLNSRYVWSPLVHELSFAQV